MNFPIKNLENYLSENWLLNGEALLEEGAVSGLTELERHLWVAQVAGAEVEIQISPSRVKAFSCDCGGFKSEKGCAHLAAALLALRRHLGEKEKASPAPPPIPKPKKTTIPGLLHHVSSEDLGDFVRDYAAQNRAFALALKARFTGLLPPEGKRGKFLELLDAAIKDVRGPDDKVGRKGALQLARFTSDLLRQASKAIAEDHPRDAAILLTSILEKIGPISRKTDGNDDKLPAALRETFALLQRLPQLSPAPELLHELWDFSLRESTKFHYRQSSIQLDFFRFLQELAPAVGKIPELIDFFKNFLGEIDHADPNRPKLLILTYQLLSSAGKEELLQSLLLEYLHEPAFILHAVDEAIAEEHWKKARFLAAKGLESAPEKSVFTTILEERLFQLALRANDSEGIVQFGAYRFLQSKDPQYLSHLKTNAGDKWPELAAQLLEQLERLPYSILKRDAIASLLFEQARFDDLYEYITRLQSLDLLLQYGPRWPEVCEPQAEELHLNILRIYLGNHLGRKPSLRVRQVLEKLFETGRRGMAERILALFRSDYAERSSLMEELESLPS